MTCYTFVSLWKFQYFRRPAYNPVEHLWWRFYCKNSKQLSISTKKLYHNARLGSKYDTAFTWRLFKRFISLKYFTSKDYWNLLFLVKYLTSFNSSKMLLTLFRMGFFGGCSRMGGGGAKRIPSLKSVTHILQWWNLAQVYLVQRRSKEYMNHVTHPLSSAHIIIFSPEISKFGYIKKYRYRLYLDG